MPELSFEKQNERIVDWANKNVNRLKGKSNSLGIVHRTDSPSSGSSVTKITDRFGYKKGAIERVSFRFPRQMIWTFRGAGKGQGGLKGSTWIGPDGERKRTNPKSFGKMGTRNRRAKDWFNSVMDDARGVDELATIVAEETGDAIVNNILIK